MEQEIVAASGEKGNNNFGVQTMCKIFLLAEKLLAPSEGPFFPCS